MTKRYMDFVPAKPTVKMPTAAPRTRVSRQVVPRTRVSQQAVVRQNTVARGGTTRMTRATARTSTVRTAVTRTGVAGQPRTRSTATNPRTTNRGPAMLFESVSKDELMAEPKLGMIEELNLHFVATNVSKRPLGQGTGAIRSNANNTPISSSVKDELTNAKSKKIGGRLRNRKAAKVKSESKRKLARKKDDYAVPNSPFINQDKVEKRPLSKNVYRSDKASTNGAKITEKKPVTIIAKPEKESHVGMIVTIILTIILGAVAGTVAFLLLPK